MPLDVGVHRGATRKRAARRAQHLIPRETPGALHGQERAHEFPNEVAGSTRGTHASPREPGGCQALRGALPQADRTRTWRSPPESTPVMTTEAEDDPALMEETRIGRDTEEGSPPSGIVTR